MKTQIVTLFTALVLVSGIANKTFAATAKSQNLTVVDDISNINKIEVHGNVELYISDGETDQVKVNNKYYSESALVQGKNGVLRITSYNAEKLVVWVSAYDLRSVAAYDNAEVKSFGNLSKIEFKVELHNNATAKLNLDAFSATVIVNDMAKAHLSGTATEYNLKYTHAENVDQKGFAAKYMTQKSTETVAATKEKIDEFADL